ncbi:fimbrillin family protein [uncultured Bacteroides sp.]|uniref:fimbrillin family protein n=1 Tax=uncultured Bacteroides sp. TaxID=162156 RepID=UPI00259422C0|nr:fimbrillin family protein [uncultured Bacteroides sp.]
MKTTKYLCLALSLTFLSCGKEETGGTDTGGVADGAMLFTASIKAPEQVNSRLTTNNSWVGISDNGIGVMIGETVRKYVVSETGEMTSETPFYWSDFSSPNVSVSAWYPYNDGVKPEVIVAADQSVVENFQKSDFLECNMDVTTESTALTFTHAGAKIICNVKLDPSFDASLNASKILLYNIAGVAEGTTIVTTSSHEALVAPQVIPAGTVLLGVELSDGRYTQMKEGTLTADLVIEKGYCYPLDVTVYPTTVEIIPQAAISWGGSPVDIESGAEGVGPGVNGDDWNQSGDESDVDGEAGTVGPDGGTNPGWNGDSSDADAGADTVDPDGGTNPGWNGNGSDVTGGSSTVDPDNGNNSDWNGNGSDVTGGSSTVDPGNGSNSDWSGNDSGVTGGSSTVDPDNGNNSDWNGDESEVNVDSETVDPGNGNTSDWSGNTAEVGTKKGTTGGGSGTTGDSSGEETNQ